MNRILIASALVLGFAGVAAAQQAPVYAGWYGPSVAGQLRDSGAQVFTSKGVDYTATASISTAPADVSGNFQADWDLRSGR